MLARLHVLLPFRLTIPDGEQYTIYEYIDDGYIVRVFPPGRSDQQYPPEGFGDLKLNGSPAFQADALRIDFQKESFNRTKGLVFDPPEEVVRRAVNSFLIRLRHVTRAAGIRLIDFPGATWRISYLNDDESELEKDETFVRGRGGLQRSLSFIALTKAVWTDMHGLPADHEPPPWEDLLLDAQGDLPRIGPAMVLAATALEVFISWALDQLAAKGSVSVDLWRWINERGNYLREPTVEEQFDALLMFLSGHSLKAENRLWVSFIQLKNARNSFVHEGRASIGGVPVSIEAARKLVTTASEIVTKVREWLPVDLQWPVFNHVVQIEAVMKLS
jgi:hypothetical protein